MTFLYNLEVEGYNISPDFTRTTKEYELTTYSDVESITINLGKKLTDYIVILRTEDSEVQQGLGTSFTFNLLGGVNTFNIQVKENEDALIGEVYKLIITKHSTSGTWPIGQTYLRPGFFGGSYVPNYRALKPIYTIGSGDKDFEGTYELEAPLNDEAIKWMDKTIYNFTKLGKLDAIVESFVHYSGFVNTDWVNDGDYRYYLPLIEVGVDRDLKMDGGFIPKNNKLFAFPFSSLKIIGYGGESELKYELFPEDVHFGIVSKFFAGTSIQLYPISYAGILDAYADGVTGQPLPVFPYTKDSYLNEWNASMNTRSQSVLAMEQNRNLAYITNGINTVSQSTQLLGSGTKQLVGSSNVLSLGANVLQNIGGQIGAIGTGLVQNAAADLTYNQGLDKMFATLRDVENRPSSIANQNASPSIPAVMKDAVVPFVQKCSIREVFARRIDEFFTRYGYKVNKFKEVDIHTRPVFNFLKCSQARVEGSIPQEDLIAIKNILEKGITFWHDPSKIYDYSVDNPAPIKNNPVYNESV